MSQLYRIALHLACLWAGGNVLWHVKGIIREIHF